MADVYGRDYFSDFLQTGFSYSFFSFTISFFVFSLLLFLIRLRPWCSCEICRSYLTSSWRAEFDNLSDWYTHLLHKSPTATIHVHILGNTITANPDNVEHIVRNRFHNYPKGKNFSTILGDLLGHGIFNVDGDHWRFQRKMASLELGSVSVRSYAFRTISSEIHSRLIPLLASTSSSAATTLDLQDVFRRFSFDSICRISFGLDPACLDLSLPMSEFAMAFDLATHHSAKRATLASPLIWKTKRLLNLGSEKQLKEAIALVNILAEEVIRQRRTSESPSTEHNLLSRFMGSVDDDKYLRDIVVNFLLAGRDTVASGLTSLFWLLDKHPEVETKVRDEVSRVMNGAEAASIEQLGEMQLLHATMHEAMRLYPPVQFDSKFPLEDDVLPDGTFVRKGSRVTYHPYAMGRMEEIWGRDCLEFKPERWLRGGKFFPENPFKYPVFQAGMRVCIGKDLALLEMKSVAAAVMQRFRIRAVETELTTPKFAAGLTATLSGGLPVRVHCLSSQ